MKTNKFDYGVSFNCEIEYDDVVGGGDEESTIDLVGNDLSKVEEYIINDSIRQGYSPKLKFYADRNHDYVGKLTNLDMGEIVSVIIEEEDEENRYVLCVICKDAYLPRIIE